MRRRTTTGPADVIRRTALVLCLAISGATAIAQDQLAELDVSELAIVTANQTKVHRFTVYLAVNSQQRARGLMFVRSLPLDQGMLFVYPQAREISMWMKNTFIPLDMLFIKADGTVHRIAKNTTPFVESSIFSQGPVVAVLELNGGVADNLSIRKGDRVLHPYFRP